MPEPLQDLGESEAELLLQPEQLWQEMTWMQEFISSLDEETRRDDPEQVVSEYLREPTPEPLEGEAGPAEEPMPILIEDSDEEDPPTPEGYRYPPYEEEDLPDQAPAPQDEAEPEAVEQEDEEALDEAEQPAGEEPQWEEEEEIEIEIEVEVEVDVEEEEEPEEDEEEDEWPLGDFEEGEEGELIGPQGEEQQDEEDDEDDMEDEEMDSEASTITDA